MRQAISPLQNLTEFLASRGLNAAHLAAQIELSLGEPLLAVATGSVVNGFGNGTSDVDLNVVVAARRVSSLPVVSHEHGLLFDGTYFNCDDIAGWPQELRDAPWPPAATVSRDTWRAALNRLFQCVRFATGVDLKVDSAWHSWLSDLRSEWLSRRVVEWWSAETYRRWIAARWLSDGKPVLSAQRYCDAVLASLEVRTAERGQLYLKPKWLPEKLRVLEDDAGLRIVKLMLQSPLKGEDIASFKVLCEDILAEAMAPPDRAEGLSLELWPAPGLEFRRVGTEMVVSRWNLRGCHLGPADDFTRDYTLSPLWKGHLADCPPPQVMQIFSRDMLWLSVVGSP